MGLRHGSLFSGIGGFDLAAEWMGWENIFHCEWNEFGQRVLKHYWPNADSLHDITKTDFTKYEGSIDIISGGFPCQPYSAAGKRLGKEDERHLWPEMLRAIRDIKPTWVVGENVRGLVNWNGGLVFDEVQSDLEAEGYEVQPFLLPAAAVNAPHRRDRIWFVAYSDRIGHHRETEENGNDTSDKYSRILQSERHDRNEVWGETQRRGAVVTDTDSRGLEGSTKVGRNSIDVEWKSEFGNATDTSSIGCNNWDHNREERHIQRNINGHASQSESEWNGWKRGISEIGEIGNATDSDSANNKAQSQKRILGQAHREWKATRFINDSTWTQWANFPTQSPICGGDDGIPRELDFITFPKWRNESIKAYGNAIVPQVALQIFKAIEQYENIKRGKDNN